MAIMGVHINGGGGNSINTSIGDELAKAIWGDAELEMKLALQRQEYESEAWKRRVWDAQAEQARQGAAYDAARTREQEIQSSRMNDVGAIADYQAGLIPDPVPVEVSQTRPDLVPPRSVKTTTVPAVDVPAGPSLGEGGSLRIGEPMPVPVDTFTRRFSPLITNEPAAIVTPEDRAAVERERAATRARVHASMAGGGNAAQIAQGMGITEGIVKSGSSDPTVREQGNVLYTGTNPPAGTGADFEMADKLRKAFAATPEFQAWSIVDNGYRNMVAAMKSLEDIPDDDPRRGPADMRLIYTYLKQLDPNTGVKEGEYATAREAGGQYAGLWNFYNRLVSGAILDNPTRMEFVRQAASMRDNAGRALEPLIKQYSDEAARFGIDANRVIRMPGPTEAYNGPLPQGVTEDMVSRVMTANPSWDRDRAIAYIQQNQGRQ